MSVQIRIVVDGNSFFNSCRVSEREAILGFENLSLIFLISAMILRARGLETPIPRITHSNRQATMDDTEKSAIMSEMGMICDTGWSPTWRARHVEKSLSPEETVKIFAYLIKF